MWEGISRPGNERDGIGGKNPQFLVPKDVPGEGPKATGNPPGRQSPAKILKIEILLKIEVY